MLLSTFKFIVKFKLLYELFNMLAVVGNKQRCELMCNLVSILEMCISISDSFICLRLLGYLIKLVFKSLHYLHLDRKLSYLNINTRTIFTLNLL
jgi:hypothetical protein